MAESLDTLVADADRTTAADELRQHHDSGRLTLDEFESRLAEAHTARTRGDLEHALRQLPRSEPPASLGHVTSAGARSRSSTPSSTWFASWSGPSRTPTTPSGR